MRMVHTADWHLGRIFNKQYLTEDQKHILDQLVGYLTDDRPDVLVISGDIFDRSIPPEEAIGLLDDFLSTVVLTLKIPTIVLGGNHDGQERMEFGSRLMRSAGLHVIGSPTRDPVQIRLEDEHGPVYFYPLPYATPIGCRDLFPEAEIKNHQDSMATFIASVRAIHPEGARSVLIAHAFVAGGEESESERLLNVGGASDVAPGLFQGFDYVALGHLHRPQKAGAEHIRYSGSLLKYSFSEADHAKGVTLAEIGAKGFAGCRQIQFSPLRDVRRIEGLMDDLVEAGRICPSDDYLLVVLLDQGAIMDSLQRLREFYPNILEVRRKVMENLDRRQTPDASGAAGKRSVEELFADFFRQVTDEELSEDQAAEFARVINATPTEEVH